MRRILPRLYLARWHDMQDCPSDTYVVNCTKDLPMAAADGHRLCVNDDGSVQAELDLRKHLSMAIDVIDPALRGSRDVCVYSANGHNRGPTVIAAYLMRYRGLTVHQAVDYVRTCKCDAFISGCSYPYWDVLATFS